MTENVSTTKIQTDEKQNLNTKTNSELKTLNSKLNCYKDRKS